jgi:hypothetical protein
MRQGTYALIAMLGFTSVGCSGADVTAAEGEIGSAQSALTTTIQAESAVDLEEGVRETIHAGYTGSSYVNIDNYNNTFAWYIFNRPTAKTVQIRIRYANGSGGNRPIHVWSGGGNSVTVNAPDTGAWTNWQWVTANGVQLPAGSNDFYLGSVVSGGMPNIDKFEIVE